MSDTPVPQTPHRVRHERRSPIGRVPLSGHGYKPPGDWLEPGRRLGMYAVVYIYEGGGGFKDERGTDQKVEAGDLIIIFPKIGHCYGPDDRGWREFFLTFDGPVFDLWRQQGLLDPDRPIRRLTPIASWLARFDRVIGPEDPAFAPPLVEVCRLQAALAEALAADQIPDQPAKWRRACRLLEEDVRQDRPLEQIAADLSMSYSSFRRGFREATGMSPGHYRSVRTIDRAAELMQQTDLTDQQIADRLGFCDPQHFSRRFQQITGRRPRAYRRRLP